MPRSGPIPIGFRRGWTGWQRDLPGLVRWATENAFAHMDFGPITVGDARRILDSGLAIGSVDLYAWADLVSPDAQQRLRAVELNAGYVREMTTLGVDTFLTVLSPAEPQRARSENFKFAAGSYAALCDAIAATGAKIVVEGAPGKAPHFASLACTPADARAFLAAIPSTALGLNFDPSHLVRTGIDPIRFLREFSSRIHHVHAKDVRFEPQDLFDHGNLQPATFAEPHRFGGHHWRYAVPGRGATNWTMLLAELQSIGYTGRISIELEDEDINGNETAEKRALLDCRDFLRGLA